MGSRPPADHRADPSLEPRILTGLSSGEGVIWAVRDPTAQDPGISDQRLLVIEPEFASALKAASREISTLSPTLRSGWDGRPLAILTRTGPARASTAHIALIGHITQHELRRHTTSLELANGYINRVLLIACRRQRLLPEGGNPDPLHGTGLDRLLAAALRTGTHSRPDPARRSRPRAVASRLPHSSPPNRTTGSSRRSPPALRRTSSGSRSSTPSPTANARSQPAPDRRARAPGLRRPIRRVGAHRRDRRSARRTDPRRPAPASGRADPQPDQPGPQPQPARRPDRPRPPRPTRRRTRHHRADPDRRPPRATLDRHQPDHPAGRGIAARAPSLHGQAAQLPLRASGSHRSPDHPPRHDTSRVPQPRIVASDQSESEAVTNARRTPARPRPGHPSLQAFPVRSPHPPRSYFFFRTPPPDAHAQRHPHAQTQRRATHGSRRVPDQPGLECRRWAPGCSCSWVPPWVAVSRAYSTATARRVSWVITLAARPSARRSVRTRRPWILVAQAAGASPIDDSVPPGPPRKGGLVGHRVRRWFACRRQSCLPRIRGLRERGGLMYCARYKGGIGWRFLRWRIGTTPPPSGRTRSSALMRTRPRN